ncbi:lanthionine synthetase LanC family protein [Neolewinella agarilytica]|uniref:Lanthionine synthetase C-like protein n=1 Tax=Neolewinella agarilytica TaxID=478744 RepID=A0A1H9KD69_9BACT|nr:lanthionine synthetase LanC family protein [Neolewinella agarilytica]SEQ97090.1 Lanthionine synthetase C-like protein [Neolewinella agarilytica]
MLTETRSIPAIDRFYERFKGNLEEYGSSFFNGLSGAALISAYLGADVDARFASLSEQLLSEVMERLRAGDLKLSTLHTFCSGLAGIVYVVDHLRENGLADNRFDEATMAELSDLFKERAMADFKKQNTDYLHGPLGVFFALLPHAHLPAVQNTLDTIFDTYLGQLRTDEKGSRIFNSVLQGQLDSGEYNMGLAHGMTGHALLWTEACRRGFRQESTRQLVYDLLKYVDKHERPAGAKKSPTHVFYPKSVIEDNPEVWAEKEEENYVSRVGWCYGDLNVAFAQLKAGRTFSDEELEQRGLALARHVAGRLDAYDAQIDENVFFCHGSAGLVYMFGCLKKTYPAELAFNRAYERWADHYRTTWENPRYDELKGYQHFSLLEGLPGAVLGTLSLDRPGLLPAADAFLLNL